MQRNRGKQKNGKDQISLQENWRYQENISCNEGDDKGQNSKDLIKAEEIKKRWQEYTKELYKKGLNNPDKHDCVVTQLEPDILECEIKWAIGNSTTIKVTGGDRIPAKLFQIHMTDFPKKDILLLGPRQSPCNTNSSCCILITALGQMEIQYRHIRRKPTGFLNHILMVIGCVHLEQLQSYQLKVSISN